MDFTIEELERILESLAETMNGDVPDTELSVLCSAFQKTEDQLLKLKGLSEHVKD